ncbi:unnamed protein product [Symbiodinium natans]|uniref:Uncharacterized protein n=1 Tax=Symbiodinium natans TaxID=878477 RepID=A0A812M0G2_9DINO|nr:unnamed protein product [Symbiodinium natans]
MTLEDRVSRAAAGNLVLAGGDGLKWAADNVIETTQLPLALVGSGNADLSAKFEAVFHQVKLDIGTDPAALQRYSMESCISFCSDYGTESQFTEVEGCDGDDLESQFARPPAAGGVIDLESDSEQVPGVPVPEAAERALQDTSAGPFRWHMGGSLMVPGLKHICSNIQGDVLARLEHFKSFQEQVKAVNTLLHQKFYRDRIKQLYKGKATERLFSFYDGGCLILWRWGSLVAVCDSLHKREGALREEWNLQRFLQTTAGNVHLELDTENNDNDQGGSDNKLFQVADSAITSPYFWAYIKFLLIVQGVVEDLSTWAEACPCHEWSRDGCGCPLRGRRAPEAASGCFEQFVSHRLATAASFFYAAACELGQNTRHFKHLSSEWRIAVDLIEAEVDTKCAHWKELPWLLCGIALPDQEQARAVASKALHRFDTHKIDPHALYTRRHPMTCRFLSRSFSGASASDVPLRGLVEDFARGGNLSDPEMKPLREWLGALRRSIAWSNKFSEILRMRLLRVWDSEYLLVSNSQTLRVFTKPFKDVTYRQLQSLVYQRAMQFRRGETSRQVVPNSDTALLRKNKRQLAESSRKNATPMQRPTAVMF